MSRGWLSSLYVPERLSRSSGLGLATVQDLIKGNAYVAILDLSPPRDGGLASSQDQRCIFIKTDITKHENVQEAVNRTVEWTKETGAVLGGVINCAGIGRPELVSVTLQFSRLQSNYRFTFYRVNARIGYRLEIKTTFYEIMGVDHGN